MPHLENAGLVFLAGFQICFRHPSWLPGPLALCARRCEAESGCWVRSQVQGLLAGSCFILQSDNFDKMASAHGKCPSLSVRQAQRSMFRAEGVISRRIHGGLRGNPIYERRRKTITLLRPQPIEAQVYRPDHTGSRHSEGPQAGLMLVLEAETRPVAVPRNVVWKGRNHLSASRLLSKRCAVRCCSRLLHSQTARQIFGLI